MVTSILLVNIYHDEILAKISVKSRISLVSFYDVSTDHINHDDHIYVAWLFRGLQECTDNFSIDRNTWEARKGLFFKEGHVVIGGETFPSDTGSICDLDERWGVAWAVAVTRHNK